MDRGDDVQLVKREGWWLLEIVGGRAEGERWELLLMYLWAGVWQEMA